MHRYSGKYFWHYEVLTKELNELEAHKLVKRTIVGDYSVKVLYTIDADADTLTPLIYALKDWGVNQRNKTFSPE